MRSVRQPRSVTLRGSHRPKPAGVKFVGLVDPKERLVVTVYLKNPAAKRYVPGSAADFAALSKPTTRRKLARQRAVEYAPAFSAVKKFARKNGLTVASVQAARRYVVLKGSAERMTRAFGAEISTYDDGGRQFRARSGSLKIPATLAAWTRSVHGFDHRPLVQLRSLAGQGTAMGLWPSDVAKLYGIPLDAVGPQQCVGIIALGGGYRPDDLKQATDAAGRPPATVVESSVDGATNQYGGGTTADEELALDMQVVAGIVPGVKLIVYFAQNNTASLASAVHKAVYDDVNRPTVLSISWGSAERFWQQGPRDTIEAALADTLSLRVGVVVASGDFLATGGLMDDSANVFFPSSSPYVLGCGGTKITVAGDAIASEVVWNEDPVGTGGGISVDYGVPDFQARTPLPLSIATGKSGRGVPDVAAAAAKDPGYRIILGGNSVPKDGTSAAAPLWASILALANARRRAPLGPANLHLYGNPALFRPTPTAPGNNRTGNVGYDAVPGTVWNACTGLGSPKGADVVAALAAAPALSG
jgi:kumamolisin